MISHNSPTCNQFNKFTHKHLRFIHLKLKVSHTHVNTHLLQELIHTCYKNPYRWFSIIIQKQSLAAVLWHSPGRAGGVGTVAWRVRAVPIALRWSQPITMSITQPVGGMRKARWQSLWGLSVWSHSHQHWQMKAMGHITFIFNHLCTMGLLQWDGGKWTWFQHLMCG